MGSTKIPEVRELTSKQKILKVARVLNGTLQAVKQIT